MEKVWYEKQIDKTINQAVKSCYAKTWEEEEITTSLLKGLKDFFNNNKYDDPLTGQTSIKFSAYKFNGKPETNYGDIALLVTIRFDNELKFKGAAFLEAKKRLKDKYEYQKSSRSDQFSTILKNAPYANLLLYDYEPLTQIVNPYADIVDSWHYDGRTLKSISPSNCVTCPLYLVKDNTVILRKITRSYSRLSEQFLNRYFYGLDLHTGDVVLETVSKFGKENSPRFVATVEVTHGDTEIDESGFTISRDQYSDL